MDEFLEQFLIESRELVEQATDDLLALEKNPADAVRIDQAFRAFHTLKGSAGIIAFEAMEQVLHFAEDRLSAARARSAALSAEAIGDCLACLDQIGEWLDDIERSESLPDEDDAAAAAQRLTRPAAASDAPASDAPTSGAPAGDTPADRTRDVAVAAVWLEKLLEAHPAAAAQARTAIHYRPDPDSFFRQLDPLGLVAALPGLLAVDVMAREPWPTLDDLDPFTCNVVISALLDATPADTAAALGSERRDGQIVALEPGPRGAVAPALTPSPRSTVSPARTPSPRGTVDPALPPQVQELLEAQCHLLAAEGMTAAAIASAGRVAANGLRYAGMAAEADRIDALAVECAARGTPAPLRGAVEAALRGEALTAGGPAGGGGPSPGIGKGASSLAEGGASSLGEGGASSLAEGEARSGAGGAPAPRARPAVRPDGGTQTLRVDAARIDSLVRLTGEFLTIKNAIGLAVRQNEASGSSLAATIKSQHAQLDRLVGELQRSVLAMRVLPLRVAFRRFPRLIRELSADLQKPAELVLEGEQTEADKAIVEMLVDPLVHVLRNAMDHGVEAPSVRKAAGKPAVAKIVVRASRHGEHVIIDVSDDGRGVDIAKVRQVARERHVAPPDEIDAWSDEQVINLIFDAGFSTADQVTGFSGRGVGMDAVRTAVRQLGGQVEAASTPGRGTTVRLTLPFSVIMTAIMTVESAGQLLGLPLDAVVETVSVPTSSITPVGTAQAIVLRGRTVPCVSLAQALGAAPKAGEKDSAHIVLVRVDGELVALQVDRIVERMEVMLKPLDGLVADLPSVAGSTLLGDGSVLLVLDPAELLR